MKQYEILWGDNMDDITKLLLLMIDKVYIEERLKVCGLCECANMECALKKVNGLIDKVSVWN